MLAYLRVKIASLKAEARIIKNRENDQTDYARRLRVSQKLNDAGLTDVQRNRIINRAANRGVFNVKKLEQHPKAGKRKTPYFDLVGRAHVISSIAAGNMSYVYPPPQQEWIDKHDQEREGLHHHRVGIVRSEARAAHLAYGFLRGVPYKAMEQKSYTPPPWQHQITVTDGSGRRTRVISADDPIERIALQFGEMSPQEIKQKLAEWKDAAGTWTHPDLVEKAAMRPSVS